MVSLTTERKSFERDSMTALRGLCTGSFWKLKQNVVVTVIDNYFVAGKLSVYLNARRSVASLTAKPMGVDVILRRLLGITDTKPLPLSFLYQGAFTCPSPDFAIAEIEREGMSPHQVAEAFFAFVATGAPKVVEQMRQLPYSEHLLAHPNQIERGAYATTLVASQIQDGRLIEAQSTAMSYASGATTCCSQFTVDGKTFHQLALQWLNGEHDRNSNA